MSLWVSIVLVIAAFGTSVLSGMIGMAGGILLLAIMFSVMEDARQVIPLHGAVQLVSNGTRTLAFLDSVDWPTIRNFAIGTIPGIFLGSLVWWFLDGKDWAQPYLRMIIGSYILIAVFLPKPKSDHQIAGRSGFMPLGFAAGAASLIVGATGPLIAPLFARRDFVKERLVATKAMCQMICHFEKLVAFSILFALGVGKKSEFTTLIGLAVAMGVAVVIGTFTGKRLLKLISPEMFVKLYRVALILAGSKVLLWDGVYKAISAGN